MAIICKRCGYESSTKSNLLKHLRRKTTCPSNLNDISIDDYIKELLYHEYNETTWDCEHCKRKFNTYQSRWRHLKTCKELRQKANTVTNKAYIEKESLNEFNKQLTELRNQNMVMDEQIAKLRLELQFYKNKTNEQLYQHLIEKYLEGTHCRLPSGVTDVSNDTTHAEIKNWDSWKEAIGQLTCYNIDAPRNFLHVYLFGRKPKKADIIFKAFNECNIKPFYFVCDEDCINIKDQYDTNVFSIEM